MRKGGSKYLDSVIMTLKNKNVQLQEGCVTFLSRFHFVYQIQLNGKIINCVEGKC